MNNLPSIIISEDGTFIKNNIDTYIRGDDALLIFDKNNKVVDSKFKIYNYKDIEHIEGIKLFKQN